MKNHSTMIWGCVALLAVAVLLAASFENAGFLLLAVGCVAMMGAMVVMMMKGGGGDPPAGGGR